MQTLQLTLTKNWFDLVAKGEKVYEYREYKAHWRLRLLNARGLRVYDEVRFANGYGKQRPYIRAEFIGSSIIKGEYCEPENGEELDPEKKYFVIALGNILEVGNR